MTSSTPPPGQPRDEDETSLNVRRAISGDRASAAWLIQRFSPLLLANADYRLGPRLRSLYDPEDIVNDVWAIALPKLVGLPARSGRFTPVVLRFLTTTLRFVISNLIQKHIQGKPGEVVAGVRNSSSSSGSPAEQLADDVTGIVTQVARRERRNTVLKSLDALSAGDREIVILRGIEQRSNIEVAEALQVPPGTAAVRYHRAIEKLRASLPGSVFEELTP